MTKFFILSLLIMVFSFNIQAASIKTQEISEFGQSLDIALNNFAKATTTLNKDITCSHTKTTYGMWLDPSAVVVTFECIIPNNCLIQDIADEQGMGHSEYILQCR